MLRRRADSIGLRVIRRGEVVKLSDRDGRVGDHRHAGSRRDLRHGTRRRKAHRAASADNYPGIRRGLEPAVKAHRLEQRV